MKEKTNLREYSSSLQDKDKNANCFDEIEDWSSIDLSYESDIKQVVNLQNYPRYDDV